MKSSLALGAQSRHGKLAGVVSLVVSLLLFGTAVATSSASDAPEKKVARGKMTFAPKSLSFGRVLEGTASQKSVSLANTSKVAIDITKINTTGAGFSAAQNCLGTLAPTTGACQVVVTFAPAAAKKPKATKVTGTLTIKDNASNNPQKVSLSGTKSGPVVIPTPTPTPSPTPTPTPSPAPTPTPTPTPTGPTPTPGAPTPTPTGGAGPTPSVMPGAAFAPILQ